QSGNHRIDGARALHTSCCLPAACRGRSQRPHGRRDRRSAGRAWGDPVLSPEGARPCGPGRQREPRPQCLLPRQLRGDERTRRLPDPQLLRRRTGRRVRPCNRLRLLTACPVHPTRAFSMKRRALFLCTCNSARSVLADATLRAWAGHRFEAFSAGSQPTGAVNSYALQQLEVEGIPTVGLRSKSWDEFAAPGVAPMELVVTVCDSAATETCPVVF